MWNWKQAHSGLLPQLDHTLDTGLWFSCFPPILVGLVLIFSFPWNVYACCFKGLFPQFCHVFQSFMFPEEEKSHYHNLETVICNMIFFSCVLFIICVWVLCLTHMKNGGSIHWPAKYQVCLCSDECVHLYLFFFSPSLHLNTQHLPEPGEMRVCAAVFLHLHTLAVSPVVQAAALSHLRFDFSTSHSSLSP